MNMKQFCCFIGIACVTVSFCPAQGLSVWPIRPAGYELYSWKDHSGSWNFCVLPAKSGSYTSADEVFRTTTRLHGVKELKPRIAKLPKGTEIMWEHQGLRDRGPKGRRDEKLEYPSAEIRQQIHLYAQKYHVEVEIPPLFH